MPTAHLIHGFNVADGGSDTVALLAPALHAAGWVVKLHDYGWVGPLLLRLRNQGVVDEVRSHLQEGDVLIGHSNGCLIAWQLADQGAPVDAVVCIQPALRRDTQWQVPCLCLHNPQDWTVRVGRLWGRLASLLTRRWHGWGSAGAYGFHSQALVVQWDTSASHWRHPAAGHSAIFKEPALSFWRARIAQWLGSA